MLKLLSNNNVVLPVDDFYILEKTSGLDELIFNISIHDENYPYILEEAVVEYEQPYLVKAIDAGSSTAKIKCQLDLDALKADMKVGYSNNSDTLAGTVDGVLPAGWLFIDHSGSTIRRTIEGDYTPYEIIVECANTFGVALRFKPKEKQIHAYDLASFKPLGAFASGELNLKEINYKGKSTDFFTRLYAYGKDGLSFSDINDGKEYVDNFTYSDKIICTVMRDERYTTKEGLLEAAKKQVATGGIPVRSYECAVYDLAKTNPEMYSFQDFSLFAVVKLIDDIKKTSINHQVVEYQRYPYYPEKNVVTLSTKATKIQNTVKNLQNQIENPQSSFRVLMQNTIDNMAASIAGYDGGNMIITQNEDGKPNGFMIMDTDSKETAKKVLWFNLNGITYSSNGANGPYNAVWSFEQGGFVADWILVGTMLADRIKGGTLTLGGKDNGDGVCSVLDADGNTIAIIDKDGIKINKGSISIGKLFSVDENGNLVANSLKSTNATITGGNINIGGLAANFYPIIFTGVSGDTVKFGPDNTIWKDILEGTTCKISGFGLAMGKTTGNGFSGDVEVNPIWGIKSVPTYNRTVSGSANVHVDSIGEFYRSASSSKRYKKDITEDISEELDPKLLYEIPIKMFKYKEGYLSKDDDKNGKDVIGFIVEDLEQCYPAAVQYADGLPEMWNANILIPAMLKLIQDQNKRIKKLEEQNGN